MSCTACTRCSKKNKVLPVNDDVYPYIKRDEIAKLAEEERILIETTPDMEEDLHQMHEQHRAEVEKQRRHLQALIEQHERDHAAARQVLEEMRRQLEQERRNRQHIVQAEVHHLQELEKSESMQRLYSSTDGLLQNSSHPVQEDVAMETEIHNSDRASASGMSASSNDTGLLGLADIYGAEIFRLKDALDGQRQEMVNAVAAAEEEWLRKEEELEQRERELEQMFLASQEHLQLEKQKLKEKERKYKAVEAAQLQVIGVQTDSQEKLEPKLQMYIDYKEKEMDLSGQRIAPLGESASDESLGSSLGYGRRRKRKQHKALTKALIDSPSERGVHSKSPYSIFAVSKTSSRGSPTPGDSGVGARPKEQSSHSTLSPSQTPSPKPKKMSLAEKVTAKLYKSGPSKKKPESTKGKDNSPLPAKKEPIHMRSKLAPSLSSKTPDSKKKKVPTATLR